MWRALLFWAEAWLPSMDIRKATAQDARAIWRVLEPVIQAGETYT